MISLTSQYAIKAVMHIARSQGWCTADEIAAAAMTPRGYISKVLKTLVETRILLSQRGLNGGFHLNGDAHALTAFDVVCAIDSIDCFGVCSHTGNIGSIYESSTDRLFTDIKSDVVLRLQRTAISDLIDFRVGPEFGARTAECRQA